MHTYTCGNNHGQKCHARGKRRESKIQELMYRNTIYVEHEMYDYTAYNWSHRNSNKRFKEKFGSHTRRTFNRFNTRNNTHNMELLQSETLSLRVGVHCCSREVSGIKDL